MLVNLDNPNKVYAVRYNSEKLTIRLFCEKCKSHNNRPTKVFDNFRSLYQHFLYMHSNNDKLEYPSRDSCIERLQIISDSIQMGVLRQ